MRVASRLKQKGLFFLPLYAIAFLIHQFYRYDYAVEIPIGLKVGSHFCIAHLPGIIINANTTLGNHVTIYQNVTIGSIVGKGVPKIGNNVVIFAGAKVVGNVKIGNNVVVGANAVVIKDVPDGCIVGGVPAKIISTDSSHIIKYYI